MLHTVHMFYKLNYHLYSGVFEVLQHLSNRQNTSFYKEKDETYHCHLLLKQGLRLILRYVEIGEGISYSALEIIMNPIRLLDGNDYYQLADERYEAAIIKAFKKAFDPIRKAFVSKKGNKYLKPFMLDLLNAYSVKRVDYAVNLYTQHSKLYMELIRRANIPDGFQQYVIFNPTSKRYEPPENSFYIFSKSQSKSKNSHVTLTVNCYDKGIQMQENELPCNDYRASNTIRFEVQCHYNKVYQTIRANGLNRVGFTQFLNQGIACSILRSFFKKTIGIGDYYTLPRARQIIQNKKIGADKKAALLRTLEMVNAKRGIWKTKDAVMDKGEFAKCVKQLHELGINPVTIPIKWGVDYLPSLFEL
ncbi:hypothetical protein PAESOLCIP111_04842 [Paenibacillus solanacearum]|uniref:Uncharacterized protein n=1 Tax=Paenibacillus solanacearum TaxID=2048548 RepID=A0A916NRS1_9BACL|nr:hypothetical protein [Paenibacillus solanacearum]CAG7644906.1 hypothetical protein PAESOLCIP111_04842 [Paenibacillus solanacearum]